IKNIKFLYDKNSNKLKNYLDTRSWFFFLKKIINIYTSLLSINKISILFKNTQFKFNFKKLYNTIMYKRKIRSNSIKFNDLYYLLFFLLLSLILKESRLFLTKLKVILEKYDIFKHKKILYIIRSLFKFLIVFNNFKTNVLGFNFLIKGKIGLAGSVKRKKFYIKFLPRSVSTKNIKISYNKDVIRTESGVLGIFFIIVYK
ncbi:MAG: hypothetical protein AAB263_05660, partial [Planctomycetota bacterium]